jgi:spermidine synthase
VAPAGWLVRLVVFVCGAVLMALEIVGSRVLAPSFGNSIFVWGSLIGVFLAALSAGYWAGGLLADRMPRVQVLGGLIAGAALLICGLPFVYPAVNAAIVAADLGPRAGPLVASAVLFFLPSVLLGAVSPFAVRLQARALVSVGATAGLLYAISTAGSIAGTLVTAFFLIAWLGVARIVYGLGLTLLLLAGVALAAGGRRTLAAVSLAGSVGLGWWLWAIGPRASSDPSIILDTDSVYHHITLRERSGGRFMDFDRMRQGGLALADPFALSMVYSWYLAVGVVFRPEPRHVLVIGLGPGALPKRLHRDYPDALIDAVEIDPRVIELAERYFGVVPDERLRVHARDGRLFVRESHERYDFVILDAYNGDTIPFHLTTLEFYRDVKARMTSDGVAVFNLVTKGPRSAFFRAMLRTIEEVFPAVHVVPAGGDSATEGNRAVIALATGPAWTRDQVIAGIPALDGKVLPAPRLLQSASTLGPPPEVGDALLLTDDYAPVDLLRAE